MYGQTELRKPDYIFIDKEVFIEIYEDSDSVRTNERYYENFKLQDDSYSYKNLQAFKEDWDVEGGDLIDYSHLIVEYSKLISIPKDLVNKEIRFETVIGNELYFHFLENNWVHLYTRENDEFYRFVDDTYRYVFPEEYEGKILMIFGGNLEMTVFYIDHYAMRSYVGNHPHSLGVSAQVLDKPYFIKAKSKRIPLFEFGYGFEIRKKGNKYGVYDVFLNKLVIEYAYDEIQLERNVIVRNGNNYGLLDYYGKELMPIAFKAISYCDNNLQYLTKENQLFYKNNKGEFIRPEDIDYKNWTPDYEKAASNGNKSWKFMKKEDGFYLISKNYKNPNQSFEKQIKIRNWEQYDKLVFASGKSESDRGTYQVIFAEKTSGKYDVFYHDANPDFSIVEKDVDRFSVHYLPYGFETSYYNFHIILHKEGLVRPLYFKNNDFKYTSLHPRFGDYYRFTLPNGRKGWVHTSGKEYLDGK